MARDSYWKALLFSIGVLCGYFAHYQPPCTEIVIRLEVPASAPQIDSYGEREVRCLRDVIYNESRNQSVAGQIAVAAVVINRALDRRWPSNICNVTRQAMQFATRAPRPTNILERRALVRAERLAIYTLNNYTILEASIRSSRYFNSGRARPNVTMTIGNHHFYEEYWL